MPDDDNDYDDNDYDDNDYDDNDYDDYDDDESTLSEHLVGLSIKRKEDSRRW